LNKVKDVKYLDYKWNAPAWLIIAWLLNRNNSKGLLNLRRGLGLGSVIGASAGIILVFLVLIPGLIIGKIAHNGIGYNINSVIPVYILYTIEIISVASAAGT
jgi:hypothetical protein